jgi:hypothetical protein
MKHVSLNTFPLFLKPYLGHDDHALHETSFFSSLSFSDSVYQMPSHSFGFIPAEFAHLGSNLSKANQNDSPLSHSRTVNHSVFDNPNYDQEVNLNLSFVPGMPVEGATSEIATWFLDHPSIFQPSDFGGILKKKNSNPPSPFKNTMFDGFLPSLPM